VAARSGPSQRATTLDPPHRREIGHEGGRVARRHRIRDRCIGGSQTPTILISTPGSVDRAGACQSAGEPNEADAISSSNEGIFADIFETLARAECHSAGMRRDQRAAPSGQFVTRFCERTRSQRHADVFRAACRPSYQAGLVRFVSTRLNAAPSKCSGAVNPALSHSFPGHPR
jgi:hypothetical protein